jgi:hypothetical protein
MPIAKLTLTFMDSQSDMSKVVIPIASLSAENFTTSIGQAAFATANTLAHLIASVSIGTAVSSEIMLPVVKNAAVPATNMYAQRELGLQVSYADTVTGKKYHLTIPAPDWESVGVPGSNKVNTTSTKWLDLVGNLEVNMVSPDGNAIAVTGGRLIGRK